MEEFCNGSEFWDINKTWTSSWPQFTECFQNTVLIWVASGWVWLVAPIYLWCLCKVKGKVLPLSWKFTLKLIILLFQFTICVIEIVNAVNDLEPEGQYLRAYLVGSTVKASTLFLVFLMVILERRFGFITSGVLFIYWTLVITTCIVPFFSKIILSEYSDDITKFVLFNGYFGLSLIQWIISCFAETRRYAEDEKHIKRNQMLKICPELEASFLSRICFWWMNKLMVMGYKNPITERDVFSLRPNDTSKTVVPRFERKWHEETIRTHLQSKCEVSLLQQRQKNLQESMENLLPDAELETPKAKNLKNKPSLLRVLIKTFGWDLLHANIYKLFYDALLFVSPLLLQLLIKFTEDKNGGSFHEHWKGYLLCAAFFVTVMLESVLYQQLYHWSYTAELRIRASLVSAVYKKALTINSTSRKESAVGEIINLMSVDVEHVQEFVAHLYMLWSLPLQICVCLYFLYRIVGASMIAGFCALFIIFPLNGFVMYKTQKYEKEELEQKDIRINLLNEILSGLKILKLYAWEMSFKEKLEAVRNVELDILRKIVICFSISDICWSVAPFLVTFATFVTYVYTHEDHFLDAKTAFVSISLFDILNFAMNVTPSVVTESMKAKVSLQRLEKFMNHDDLDPESVLRDIDGDDAIVITDGKFLWGEDIGSCLSNINIRIPEGRLVAVVGQVGSGKSSLVSAILGEMVKLNGYVNVKGTTAYVPQQAWIQNASLRDNILFGRAMEDRKYEVVVEACALNPDIDMLAAGDLTEIGERGINLSGGQKQRISLARAVYKESDIYLLDDPLSAVDSHVGKHIFDKVISDNGVLKNKTRVLITHGVHWLPKVDTIIVINNGRVSEMGSYDELLSHAGAFATFLQTYLQQNDDEEEEDPEDLTFNVWTVRQVKEEIRQRLISVTSDEIQRASEEDTAAYQIKQNELISICKEKIKDEAESDTSSLHDTLIEEETTMTGSVKFEVYLSYAKAMGIPYAILIVLLLGLYHALVTFSSVWLSKWTGDDILNNRSLPANSSTYQERNNYYTGIYGAWGAGQGVSVIVCVYLLMKRSVRAAKILHEGMLHSIIRSPMSFLDTTPTGRIVNRFSLDIESIDNEIPVTFELALDALFTVVATLVIISYSTPVFIIVIIPLGILYFLIQRFYIKTSRQLKRIESKSNSPIYNHFGETLAGVSVIRAFAEQERFINEFEVKVENNQQIKFASYCADRWLGFGLAFVGNCVILAASLFAVMNRDSISASIVGLSISYSLEITEHLSWFIEMVSDLETKIVAVERVREYTDIPHEDSLIYKSHRPPSQWPDEGVVRFNNYSARYRPGLDLALDGIDATIQSGEKVGIVGRTGAGKSSLTLALFRLIEPVEGSIVIDGENINNMGLHDCRSRLTILPQDPVLFSGSVRANIDPLEEYTDGQLWQALEHSHLKTFVESLPLRLDYECGEEGQNFSVGQKQLLCLARSLLRKTKILVLDEATAAVDMETDDLIQQTIRTEFKDCTVLTVAHRINTVMDYDRIMVLDQGHIREFDSPDNLMQQTESLFYQLAKAAGITHQTT